MGRAILLLPSSNRGLRTSKLAEERCEAAKPLLGAARVGEYADGEDPGRKKMLDDLFLAVSAFRPRAELDPKPC